MFKFIFKSALVLFILIIVALVIFIVSIPFINSSLEKKIDAKIRQMKQDGKPVEISEISPPSVADECNAAIPLKKAFLTMTSGKGGQPFTLEKGGELNNHFSFIQEISSFSDSSLWSEDEKTKIDTLMQSTIFQQFYDELAKAAELPGCNFGFTYDKGIESALPPATEFRTVIELLSIKALYDMKSNDFRSADRSILCALNITEHLKNEPTAIMGLLRIACFSIITKSLRQLIRADVANVSIYIGISNAISQIDHRKSMARALAGERLIMGLYTHDQFMERSLRGIVGYLLKPFILSSKLFYLSRMDTIEDVIQKPWYQTVETTSTLDAPIPFYLFLSSILSLNYGILQRACTRLDAWIEMSKIACALKIYQIQHGDYPESLDALKSAVFPLIPVDPFTGKGFIYRKTPDFFVLYSLGPNMKDDGGKDIQELSSEEKKSSLAYDCVFSKG